MGYYGTDNSFTFKDVTARTLYITSEFEKRGVRVLCTGSDGDLSFIKSQKLLLNFGDFSTFGPIELVANPNTTFHANQDAFHIAKKLKSGLYDMSDLKRLGNFSATLAHLIMVLKRFPKHEHGLNPSDLDPSDKMNYK